MANGMHALHTHEQGKEQLKYSKVNPTRERERIFMSSSYNDFWVENEMILSKQKNEEKKSLFPQLNIPEKRLSQAVWLFALVIWVQLHNDNEKCVSKNRKSRFRVAKRFAAK